MTFTSDRVRTDPRDGEGRLDAAAKPRVHRRGALEYLAWFACALVVFGVFRTLLGNENYQWGVVAEYLTVSTVLRGVVMTIVLTILAMTLGSLLGLFLAVLRVSPLRPLRILAGAYITFFRGTPVLVQLIFWFNIAALYPHLAIGIPFTGVSQDIDVNRLISATTAAVIGLSLNQAAYQAEIFRGGFANVDKGQVEAADSLGMSRIRPCPRSSRRRATSSSGC